jgi:hypothetical protein
MKLCPNGGYRGQTESLPYIKNLAFGVVFLGEISKNINKVLDKIKYSAIISLETQRLLKYS